MNAAVNPNRKRFVFAGWVLWIGVVSLLLAVLNFFRFLPNPNFIAEYSQLLFWSTFVIAGLAAFPPIKQLWLNSLASDKPELSDNPKIEKAGQAATSVLLFLIAALVFWLGLYTFTVFAGPLVSTFVYSSTTQAELTIERKHSSRLCRRGLHFEEIGLWGSVCGVDRELRDNTRVCDRVVAIGVGNAFGLRVRKLEALPTDPTHSKAATAVDC